MLVDLMSDQTCQCVKELDTHLRVEVLFQVLRPTDCSTCDVDIDSPGVAIFVETIPAHIFAKILRNGPPDAIMRRYLDTDVGWNKCSVCQAPFSYEYIFNICPSCYWSLFAPHCSSSLNSKITIDVDRFSD